MSLREGYLKHAAPEAIVAHLKDLHEKRRGIDREMQEEQDALANQALGMLNTPGIPGGGGEFRPQRRHDRAGLPAP